VNAGEELERLYSNFERQKSIAPLQLKAPPTKV